MRFILAALFSFASLTSYASAACTDAADGFASLNGGTTGGAGGTVVTVTTQADLTKYAGTSGKYIIKIPGKITISPKGTEIKVASDKTIIGTSTSSEIFAGGFMLPGSKNVIIRNLKIGESAGLTRPNVSLKDTINNISSGNTYDPTDYEGKLHDWDAVQMDTASNVWIDHCHLVQGADGLIDSRIDTNYLTVSYTIFENHNKAFGIGWTDNVVAQITIHHCYFHNTNQRNPSADNIKYAHLYNNYLNNVTSYGHYARGSTAMQMENVYFQKVKNPVTKDSSAALAASGNVYSGCSGTIASNDGSVFKASSFYSYKLDATSDVPTIVTGNAGVRSNICT